MVRDKVAKINKSVIMKSSSCTTVCLPIDISTLWEESISTGNDWTETVQHLLDGQNSFELAYHNFIPENSYNPHYYYYHYYYYYGVVSRAKPVRSLPLVSIH